MKLPTSIQTKATTKLFHNKYKYKIVLVSKVAKWFRGNNLAHVKLLANHALVQQGKISKSDLDFAIRILTVLGNMDDYTLRVENPFLNIYTNTDDNVLKLSKLDVNRVKFVCLPAPNTESLLNEDSVIVKKLDFDYKVTMGRTNNSFESFVSWAKDNSNIKISKKAIKELSRDYSFGGYYFYVKGEKNLTLVKVFLGSNIQAVSNCVKV